MASYDSELRHGEFVGIAGPLGVLGTGPTGTSAIVLHVDVWTDFLHARLLLVPSDDDRRERERLNAMDDAEDQAGRPVGAVTFVLDLAMSLGFEVRSGSESYDRLAAGAGGSDHPWAAEFSFEGPWDPLAGINLRLASDPSATGIHLLPENLDDYGL